MKFKLESPFEPTGDQPQAIAQLVNGVEQGKKNQVLLGVTGSGKTFTMAKVIEQAQQPTLVIAHNKTLAAQLYQEFRDFFPTNAVSYFVSYYDYYQPEAYLPSSDTYIEKEATINDEIDRLRLATTTNLLTRPDVIVVASVSCIYNLGSPLEYGQYILRLAEGEIIQKQTILLQLVNLQYERSDADLKRGSFRERGESIQIWPAYENRAVRVELNDQAIEKIRWIDPTSGSVIDQPNLQQPARFILYPAKHYVINPVSQQDAIKQIRTDLTAREQVFQTQKKLVEGIRIKQKVGYDLEMIEQYGFVNGIENYSRYFDGRQPGEPPFSLLDYFQKNTQLFGSQSFLTFVDESHITLPQISGMYRGDEARKKNLIDYGFRLPSALDNRPLRFDEFDQRTPQLIAVSATPRELEIKRADGQVIEQLVRPTGLLDPIVELRSPVGQIEDLMKEILLRKHKGQRVLVTTLTKRMAEALTDYFNDAKKVAELANTITPDQDPDVATFFVDETLPIDQMPIGPIDPRYYSRFDKKQVIDPHDLPKVAYLHSDIETLDRSDILRDLRQGVYDVLIGINLLREGLDLPEVSLVVILDADKEGFLRSQTSLVQTMGRAARHLDGRAILYAYNLTQSMQTAVGETQRRRQVQKAYNQKHHINPTSISKPIKTDLITRKKDEEETQARTAVKVKLENTEKIDLAHLNPNDFTPKERQQLIKQLRQQMKQASDNLDFELAALLRDAIVILS